MRSTGVVIDPHCQQHLTPPGHPERPERLAALLELMQRYRRQGLKSLATRPASIEELCYAHNPEYVQRVAQTAGREFTAFDPDTSASPHSYDAARLAAGGFLTLLDAIMAQHVSNGFALVRPPGHHAERAGAMGFCLFNNVAVAAHHLRKRHGLERVLIVDFDVHHGNGTEHAFYDDPHVMYVSLHQWPHYPGTGAVSDVGRGAGAGYTVNVPLPPGCGDGEYLCAFQRIIDPIARQFDPQFVLVSAGFDAHERDPLGDMRLSEEGFALMTRALLNVADDHAQGRLGLVLEGGYDLEALTGSVARALDELGGQNLDVPSRGFSALVAIHQAIEIQKRYWVL